MVASAHESPHRLVIAPWEITRSASCFPCGNRSGKPPVVGAVSNGMAARISPLAADRCPGNELNPSAHRELDIDC
jgi:hypothetical protein